MNNFEDSVRKWVHLDDEIKKTNDLIRELRAKRNSIAEGIHLHVDKNNLSNATINISDGRLRFVETQSAQTLTFKFLEQCLQEIIPNRESVINILNYVKSKRKVKNFPEIKRYYNE